MPEVAGESLQVFHLAFDSLAGEDFFQVASVGEPELRDLYAEPFFFKAVEVEADGETLDRLRAGRREAIGGGTDAVGAEAQRGAKNWRPSKAAANLSTAERQQLRRRRSQAPRVPPAVADLGRRAREPGRCGR